MAKPRLSWDERRRVRIRRVRLVVGIGGLVPATVITQLRRLVDRLACGDVLRVLRYCVRGVRKTDGKEVSALQAILVGLFWSSLVPPVAAAFAQAANPAPTDIGVFARGSFLTSREFVTSISVLVFGLTMTLTAVFLLTRGRQSIDSVVRLFALIIIVTGTLFLVAAGFDAKDIAPSMGLLGTIAGYLLGRSSSHDGDASNTPK
jgi:hypothetical protein